MTKTNNIIKTYFEGDWHDGSVPIMRSADHGSWLGVTVFDGARRFEGVYPDLELHCQRIIRSAQAMGLNPAIEAEEITGLAVEGLGLIDDQHDVYVRPMMWSVGRGPGFIEPNPDDVGFALCLEVVPMPPADKMAKLALSPYRRPTMENAIANAKSGALYVNSGRIIAEARRRGFDNAVVCDANGNVAETGSTNIFMVKDGVVFTPMPNYTFLPGLTRARVMTLLKSEGIEVIESTLRVEDFQNADEIFITANLSKILPIIQFEDIHYEYGPIVKKIRSLYWQWAHSTATC